MYKSFRAQAGINEEGCIAAMGDDSIMNETRLEMNSLLEILLAIEFIQLKFTV